MNTNNDMMKRRVWVYSVVGVAILLIAILTAMIIGFNTNPKSSNNPNNPQSPDINDKDKDAAVVEEKFILPMTDQYEVFRHYYNESLSDAEKANAIFKGQTTVGVTLINKNNTDFNVVAPMTGKITAIEDLDRGKMVQITSDGIVVELHSLKNVVVELGSTIKAGDKVATSSVNSFDPEAGSNLYFTLKLSKRVNPMDFIGKKLSELVDK